MPKVRYVGDSSSWGTVGEIYFDENTTEFTVNTADAWHSSLNFTDGLRAGFDYSTGVAKTITSIADAGGGSVAVTAAAHTLSNGQIITITGTTNYNGIYPVTNATTDTFDVVAAWGVTEAGFVNKGNNLTLTGDPGLFKVSFSFSIKAIVKDVLLTFAAAINTEIQKPTISSSFFDNISDVFNVAGHGFVTMATGDHLTFIVKNETSASNILARYGALSVVKLR